MQKTLQAVYKAGVLRPLDPLPLAEMQQVSVTITDSPATGEDIADTKWEEARRVLVTLLTGDLPLVKVRAAEDFGQLLAGVPAGAWVAISHDKQRVVAYAAEMGEAISKAKELGEEDPILVRIHSRLPL